MHFWQFKILKQQWNWRMNLFSAVRVRCWMKCRDFITDGPQMSFSYRWLELVSNEQANRRRGSNRTSGFSTFNTHLKISPFRWTGHPSGGTVSQASGVPHPIRGGGEGLSSGSRAASAPHRLLELPRERGGHQVRSTTESLSHFLFSLFTNKMLTLLLCVK